MYICRLFSNEACSVGEFIVQRQSEYRMKICILTPRFPFPQYGGDVLRINEIARYLKSRGHSLVLVSMSDGKKPPVNKALELYDKVFFVHRNRMESYVNGLLFLLWNKPLQCGYYYSRKYEHLLKEVVEAEQPDLYISHLLRMSTYLERLGVQSKSIVEMTDALSKTYTLSSRAQGVGLLKYIYGIERNFIARYEQYAIANFPKVVLVSQPDLEYLRDRCEGEGGSLRMYTNGVDVMPALPTSYRRDKICFMGNMRSMQNQDAVIYFVHHVFPLVKRRVPDAKFYVVGSLPPDNILALASDDIIVTGFVDNLEGVISDSCLAVAPVRVAAGIQNKVLVAMGCGLPVVMTPLIARAIPELVDGINCLICDGDHMMADACVRLMENPELRNAIGREGYATVCHDYSWDNKLEDYECLPSNDR